jgi:hypothetical protein
VADLVNRLETVALETRNVLFVRQQLGKPSPTARIAAYAVNMTTVAQRSYIEHEVHHLAAKLRIFRFESIKQPFIPWASPVVLASELQSAPRRDAQAQNILFPYCSQIPLRYLAHHLSPTIPPSPVWSRRFCAVPRPPNASVPLQFCGQNSPPSAAALHRTNAQRRHQVAARQKVAAHVPEICFFA